MTESPLERRRLSAVDALARLEELAKQRGDVEGRHEEADAILCDLIAGSYPLGVEIAAAFNAIPKWYA